MRRHGTILLVCAWVLWMETTFMKPGEVRKEWSPVFAVPAESYGTCLEIIKRQTEKMTGTKVEGGGYSVKLPEGMGTMSVQHQCLPDTIDPRK